MILVFVFLGNIQEELNRETFPVSRLKESMQWHYLLFLSYIPLLRFYFYYSVSCLGYILYYAFDLFDLVFISSFPRIRFFFSIQFPGLGTLRPTVIIFSIPFLFSFLVPVALQAQPLWLYLHLSCSRVFSLLPISGYFFSHLLWSSGSLAPLQFDSRPATRRMQTKQIKQGGRTTLKQFPEGV